MSATDDLQRDDAIEVLKDGAAMIRGTRTEAHRLAALVAGGMPIDEILFDYPGLTDAQVRAAVAYAKAHPWRGAPFPSRTLKSSLRQGEGGLAKAFKAARARG
jgi:uncharacterized protein (DUF433 family)